MSILKILYYPNKYLRTKASKVKIINLKIKNIINNMFDTMYYFNGIGLSSTQINIHKQIFIIDISNKNKNKKFIIINPEIIYKSKNKINSLEGCLSFPNIFCKVNRSSYISIKYTNINNNICIINTNDNLLSACIQHEIDHLNGKLFIDKLSKLEKKIKKIKNE